MQFDLARVSTPLRIIGATAIVLFLDMFLLHWYSGATVHADGISQHVSIGADGWNGLPTDRWFILITILAALALVVAKGSGRQISSPVPPSTIVTVLGGLITLLILIRIIDTPGGDGVSTDIGVGIILGIILAAGLTYGGWLEMKAEGADFSQMTKAVRGGIDQVAPRGGSSKTSAPAPAPAPTPTPGPASTWKSEDPAEADVTRVRSRDT
jgi:hypothetical protein